MFVNLRISLNLFQVVEFSSGAWFKLLDCWDSTLATKDVYEVDKLMYIFDTIIFDFKKRLNGS